MKKKISLTTFFESLGIARQIMEKLGSDPSLDPIRAQTLTKKILNQLKLYLLYNTFAKKNIDMKITFC